MSTKKTVRGVPSFGKINLDQPISLPVSDEIKSPIVRSIARQVSALAAASKTQPVRDTGWEEGY